MKKILTIILLATVITPNISLAYSSYRASSFRSSSFRANSYSRPSYKPSYSAPRPTTRVAPVSRPVTKPTLVKKATATTTKPAQELAQPVPTDNSFSNFWLWAWIFSHNRNSGNSIEKCNDSDKITTNDCLKKDKKW